MGVLRDWVRDHGRRVRRALRAYAGAKITVSTGDWSPVDETINALTANSGPQLRARARALIRDYPHAARALQLLEDYTVGDGLRLQARVRDPSGDGLATRINQQIEDAWRFWGDTCHLGRTLHFDELTRVAKRGDAEAGEFLCVLRQTRGRDRYLPLALELVEADRLSWWNSGTRSLPGNEIDQGVEYDPRTGAVQAYHLEEDELTTRSRRIPAAEVVHGFQTLRPGQRRGVTPFAPAILYAHALRDYLEAEIDGAKMAARWLAFIKSADPISAMNAFGAYDDTISSDPEQRTRKIEEMGTSIREYLYPDEDVTIAQHNRPSDNFDPFTAFMLRALSVVVGVSYEFLTNDYRGMSYSVQKGSRTAFAQQVRILRARHVRQWCERIYREFLRWAVLTGKLDLPRFFSDPYPFYRVVWLGPGMESIDPLREGKAAIELIKANLLSPQRYLLAQGVDPEQNLDELADWQMMLEDRELIAQPVATPLQNNPAAVDPETSEEAEDRALVRVK